MPQPVIIDKPIINSPFKEPTQHFVFGEEGITNEIADRRRVICLLCAHSSPADRGRW